jgi:hypothetical protein
LHVPLDEQGVFFGFMQLIVGAELLGGWWSERLTEDTVVLLVLVCCNCFEVAGIGIVFDTGVLFVS